ncbi:MAG: UDP-N-acetylglucosamine pyrophosphorylase [Deltaproteobacteria bacterium]|nr:UDP-N-acetylglucosamine pyrophosphorylase [Deltaproteobacteria bacterium]
MEFVGHSLEKIKSLISKGVKILNPFSVDIGEEVNIDLISSSGVIIYPGCRIYGSKTVISSNTKLGTEGPVTVVDCRIGKSVELKGGFFFNSVFLEKAVAGYGSHVREGCIFEEEASCAHCCGLKHTILFPFVTLGSLINFCDCLIAGGTSRRNHSEVGSSYVHFNFTPHGDKATPSLFGDVPRGVMLSEPPIFLGGQGGAVGPVRVGYGNVIAAGSIIRNDYIEENKLIIGKGHSGKVIEFKRNSYSDLRRIVANNLIYLSNLVALREWYRHIRREFVFREEFGEYIYNGLLEIVELALKERLTRLRQLSENLRAEKKEELELKDGVSKLEDYLDPTDDDSQPLREEFKREVISFLQSGFSYIDTIKRLPEKVKRTGTLWLQGVMMHYLSKVQEHLPSFNFMAKVKF